jgi:ABC-2 type transport system permease protein
MRSIKTIFIKQAKDMFSNPAVLVQFFLFPVVAFIMTELVAKANDDIPDTMFTTMMAAIFAGMALITSVAGFIAEDTERKSLRLLVMAGVKPHQYLAGLGGFILLMGIIVSLIFALIAGLSGMEFLKFLAVMILATAASIILGAIIGIIAKNQQAATAIAMPAALIFGFTPMIANFNETVREVSSFFYTQQLNVIVNDFSANFNEAVTVIAINIAIFIILFAIAYRKRGLRG